MKRSPLRRRTPMQRSRTKGRPARTKYKSRERDTEYMLLVKTLACFAWPMGDCEGVVEADHAGRRGLGRKAADDTCIPLCTKHHRERTDFSGAFRSFDQARMRAWLEEAITHTRASLVA